MKSSQKQLQDRGQLNQSMINDYMNYSKEELVLLLNNVPSIRTVAIHLLSLKYQQDNDYTDILLTQLIKEKALYTKIEIQDNLAKYGDPIKMCHYLGLIGNNQYKEIPTRGSFKKSYPLPRDIIARSLAHMEKNHFKDFFDCLPTLTYQQLLEGIDALGYICFYNNDLATLDVYHYIETLIRQYHNDLLMAWKLITCLSAFHQSHDLLMELKHKQKHPTILKEIERSLKNV